jgi:hypothetical protein
MATRACTCSMGALGCPALAAGAAQCTALAAGDQGVEEGGWRVVVQQGQHTPVHLCVSKNCQMAGERRVPC